ncbi:FG-GAP and VCBS repeat-containing protein [Wenjunlia tyrosinilytica]|uniref:FG-GAP repeat protein n=1 Tax=Wenjunlia tyrosinilytica TaxID=1544741 RepID=A0A917ZM60_9ACTN|nr:FG-GAP-like repeat-containing protein [Wenjunlia tyrosinilytica]GGO84931.1 hypothetical protein GCM10012280_17540 [Wenjunlia tyrosinilytica]
MGKHRTAAVAASLLLLGGAAITAAGSPAAAGPLPPPATHDDFNGDGYPDLVVSAPDATIGGHTKAGYIAVLYGGASGISTSKRTVISQNTAGVPGSAETGDRFGRATASGDFDGDGFPDLAVGMPGEDIGTVTDAGAITVLWGSARGLTGDSLWLEDDIPAAGNAYGRAVATGDFDEAGRAELATLTGQDFVYYRFEASGPSAAPRAVRAHSRRVGAHSPGGGKAADATVNAVGLTAGDYNRDHHDDLIVLGTASDGTDTVGWAQSWFGTATGELTLGRDFAGGTVGASGDIDGDGYDDLVTAYPAQKGSSGQIKVWRGSADGPVGQTGPDDPRVWTQESPGVPGTAEAGDRWGSDLSIGDVNGDQFPDVAIGADGEDIGSVADAGAVWLLRGSAQGLTATGAQSFDQNSADVPGTAEKSDRFGGQVRLIDANRDGKAGLIAAAPGENTDDGVAWLFNGTASGLTAKGSWTFGGGSLNAPSADARFGATLAE